MLNIIVIPVQYKLVLYEENCLHISFAIIMRRCRCTKRDDKAISSEILAEFERMKADFTENDNEWVFVKVFDAENQSKDDIFTKALEVLVSLYKDAKEVIQIKDKESGLIVGKGFSDSDIRTINWTTICRNRCWHIIKIEIKDNKFRVTVTVSGVEREQDADLRHPFDGTEYTLRRNKV